MKRPRTKQNTPPARPAEGEIILAVRGLRIENLGRIVAVFSRNAARIGGVRYDKIRWIAPGVWAVPNEAGETYSVMEKKRRAGEQDPDRRVPGDLEA
jgi:sarcosine oxidase gamma subunit